MAGVTDRAFRYMCKKYGAGGMTTEMVSAKAICYGDKKTAKLAYIAPEERPCGLQLFGSDPEIMARAAVSVFDMFCPEFIDVNMGCPAPKIVNNGEGSSLMKNPKLCYEIVKSMKTALDGRCPLTVKIRRGFDKDSINATVVAKMCEDAGADAIFVHARTREQMYMPPVEYSTIAEVKRTVKIPVIGNGDILCGLDARRMYEETGCDGVMVGRGSQGNPYIFDEIRSYLEGREYTPPTNEQKCNDVKEHIKMLVEDKGEFIGVCEARKHVAWYIKGMPGSAAMRNRVNTSQTLDEVLSLIDEAFAF
jgi:nifR3 family TIM-barrel protein